MNQEKNNQTGEQAMNQEDLNKEIYEESPYDTYGWEFHKWPLFYALILTIAFYAFVFFYINV